MRAESLAPPRTQAEAYEIYLLVKRVYFRVYKPAGSLPNEARVMTHPVRPSIEITEGLRDWSDNRRDDSAEALLKLVREPHRPATACVKIGNSDRRTLAKSEKDF
jgi:hypothetical protein